MNEININGKIYNVPYGASVSISNDIVYVNGVPLETEKLSGIVKIDVAGTLVNLRVDRGDVEVHGYVQNDLHCGGSATIRGNVGGKVYAGGSVTCNDVGGKVDAGGSVTCGNVTENVDAGGSIKCGDVGGKANAGGSVKRK